MKCRLSVLQLSDVESKELVEGAQVRFVHSENMTVAYWSFEPGVLVPDHAHPHEQVTNIIEGTFDLTVEGETYRLEAGSVVVIPPEARHHGESVTGCYIVDVFYPVREDYR